VAVRVADEALRGIAPGDEVAAGVEAGWSRIARHVADQGHLVDVYALV